MDIEKLKKLVKEGKNYSELSEELGVSKSWIRKQCKDLGINPTLEIAQTNNPETAAKIENLLNEGKTNTEISKILGISPGAVRRCTTEVLKRETNSVKAKKIKEVNLTQEQLEIIYGSLLGDLCITKTKKLARFIISQGGTHEQYFDHLYSKFEGLMGKVSKTPRFDKRTNKYYNKFVAKALAHEKYLEIYNEIYINGVKTITKEWLDKLTPRSIAYWFMDDGSIRGVFATNSFTKEGCEMLVDFLWSKFKIKARTKQVVNHVLIDQYIVIIDRVYLLKFEDLIRPYMVESMKYKLYHK